VIRIRAEIDAARTRLAETLDALAYKADVPARLGDTLAATAAGVTARVLDRLPASDDPGTDGSGTDE
jgi:hypothetical protein